MAQLITGVFGALRVSASVQNQGSWWAIHRELSVGPFEIEHGLEAERYAYNTRNLSQARRQRRIIRGEHAGYSDLFVPIVAAHEAVAVLVVGPFALARPTSADILERWRALTGLQGHPADPEFASYLSASLATLVLDGGRAATFERLLACLAQLIAGEGVADELANRADALRVELEPARLVENTWEAVQTMLDERSSRIWSSAHSAHELGRLGLSRIADHVLVGLCASRTPGVDPVDDAVRLHAFQRSSVELARAVGEAIAGQVGDHGVVFLSASSGGGSRKRQKLRDLAERAQALSRRRFGLSLHFGASAALGSTPLSRSYQAALAAA
ncbi:MAG TPA: hypothetical protein VGP93_04825, partial [Polyangiaceae bacterium]|nr:hypothetical protein [Polyangiaceae bacterium]